MHPIENMVCDLRQDIKSHIIAEFEKKLRDSFKHIPSENSQEYQLYLNFFLSGINFGMEITLKQMG